MLLCEVVQQLDIPRLQQELHPELVTAGQGGKDGQGLLLLGGQAGNPAQIWQPSGILKRNCSLFEADLAR